LFLGFRGESPVARPPALLGNQAGWPGFLVAAVETLDLAHAQAQHLRGFLLRQPTLLDADHQLGAIQLLLAHRQ